MLRNIALMIILLNGVVFSQDLPASLFVNTELYDLTTLLSKDGPIHFSQATQTNILSLPSVIDLAVQNNLELAQSKKELDSTKALYTGSIQDFYVPNLSTSIGVSATDYFGSSKNKVIGGITIPNATSFDNQGFFINFTVPTVTLSKTVFNGLGTLYAHRIAKENYLSAQNIYTNKIREVIFEAVTRYYDQILKQEEVKLALDRLKQLKGQLELAEINFKNGRVSDYDVALARSQFYAAQPDFYRAEKNRMVAEEDFFRYIRLKPSTNQYMQLEGELLEVTNIQFSSFDDEESLNFILTNDTVLQQLRTAFKNAKNIKGQQNSVRMPKIDLNFSFNPSYGANTPASQFNQATYEGTYSLGASLRIPILEWIPGTGVASQVKSANEQIKKAEFTLLDAEEQKIIEVKDTLLSIRELNQTVEALKITEIQSKRALEIANEQYRAGRLSLLELDKAQTDYNDARRQLVAAVYNEFRTKLFLQASINNLSMFVEEVSKINAVQ
ncbi:MAG: TolC family protein [Brevinema sp.]